MGPSHGRPPQRPFASRTAGLLLRLPAGLLLTTWRYLWRVTALHRAEEEGDGSDLPPPLPADLADGAVQRLGDGFGPLLHRRFTVRIEEASSDPAALLDTVAHNLDRPAPFGVAEFRKTLGDEEDARVGHEYRVKMPGPWDGPVRVVHRDATSLRLATLKGHLEAGQVEFRTAAQEGFLCFEVEAWARAGDRLADLVYGRLRVAKEVQFNMWVHFCLRVARIAGGRPHGGVSILTRVVDPELCRGAEDR
ncbi:DUF1990 family protein [Streptomyces montanisoli]|uniref:DUF1990 family protein n=1 Tax=Streptomyces montanisoli TaxID=2798581 RepID=A0A940M6L1_9ACTN|nr:DUF1990 family protein [Streptomyces montanisoli]MBP0457125.1 DUF1990 family protein [Streptomyces montanisoli]